MTKNLLITHDFPPGLSGGISAFYHNLCTQLGNAIQVLAPKCGDWEIFDQQQSYIIHRRAIPMIPSTFMRKIQMRLWHVMCLAYIAVTQFVLYVTHSYWIVIREKIDFVLVGHLYLATVGWFIQLITGRPYAIILHGSELHRYWRFNLARQVFIALLNRANFLVVNSEFTRQQYLTQGVRTDHTFLHIYPGIDITRFEPDVDFEAIVDRHQLAGRCVVLTVARLVEWKGQDMVIRAMPHVVQVVPNAVYIMVGEGPHRQALERLVTELDMQDHVIFAGFIPDEELGLYYAAARVMVLVSREIHPRMPIEGFGIAYLEANAAERPVIGGRMGGAVEAIVDGVTGLLVDPNDDEEIGLAIVRLLTDSALARQMGVQGRMRAVREFNWQTQAAKLRGQLQISTATESAI